MRRASSEPTRQGGQKGSAALISSGKLIRESRRVDFGIRVPTPQNLYYARVR
jgi:hypothetical protein